MMWRGLPDWIHWFTAWASREERRESASRMRMRRRTLSMSSMRSEQVSEIRSPQAYVVMKTARCLADGIAASSVWTSEPFKTLTLVCGTFGLHKPATTSCRCSVTP